jgi:hypothetical protein
MSNVTLVDEVGKYLSRLPVTLSGGVSAGASMTLLSAASATGTGQTWAGGDAAFAVYGTFGGSTVALQVSPDAGTTWIDVNGTAQTAAGGAGPVSIPTGWRVRASVTGGAGVSVTALLTGL